MNHQYTSPALAMVRSFWATFFSFVLAAMIFSFGVPSSAYADEGATIDEGVYVIHSKVGDDKVLDISGAYTSNGGNVQIYQHNGSYAQYWRIEAVDEHYRIVNSVTGIALDVENGAKHDGANVQVYEWNESNAQLWDIVPQKDSEGNNTGYVITSVCSGLALDVASGQNVNGANVHMYASNNTQAQIWNLSRVTPIVEDGIYTIASSKNSNRVLDIKNGSKENGGIVQLWDSNDSMAQKWDIAFNEETGFYTIRTAVSGKSLDIPNGVAGNGKKLQQYSVNGTVAQYWNISQGSEGSYSIQSVLGAFSMDVPNGVPGAGTQIQLWDINHTAAQQWLLESTDYDLTGLYRIGSSINPSSVLDVSNASKATDAKLQVWSWNDSFAQKWQLSKLDDGSYTIRCANSGLYLADDGSARVKHFSSTDDASARWLVSIGNGGLTFLNTSTGKALDLSGANTSRGTAVATYEANETSAQAWVLESTSLLEEGCYTILNDAGNEQALDVPNASSNWGVDLQTYEANNSAAQKWNVEKLDDEWYTIVNAGNGLALDVEDAKANPGTPVQQWETNASAAQQWKFEIAPNGGIQIKSKLGDFVIMPADDAVQSGTQVVIDTPLNSNTCSWTFEETSMITEVDDIWGDSAYISRMRQIAAREGSDTGWIAIVDKSGDRCTVFYRSGGQWVLANSMDVLTSGNTFEGTHEVYIHARGYWKEPDCYNVNDWYVGYVEDWWSSPSSDHMRYVSGMGYDEGQGFHFGYAGSGCICIPDYDKAKWLYDNVEDASTVHIF